MPEEVQNKSEESVERLEQEQVQFRLQYTDILDGPW